MGKMSCFELPPDTAANKQNYAINDESCKLHSRPQTVAQACPVLLAQQDHTWLCDRTMLVFEGREYLLRGASTC